MWSITRVRGEGKYWRCLSNPRDSDIPACKLPHCIFAQATVASLALENSSRAALGS